MKKFCFASALMLIIFAVAGCHTIDEKGVEAPDEICGSAEFFSSVKSLGITATKAGELSEEDIMAQITPMFPLAIDYLGKNGYNYREDFSDNDPNIIMVALALYDYDLHQPETKASFTSVLSCIALGTDLGIATGMGAKVIAKKIAKEVAKAALKRAVPAVGVAIGIVSATLCLAELE